MKLNRCPDMQITLLYNILNTILYDLYSVVHFNFDRPKFSESEILEHSSDEKQIKERQFGAPSNQKRRVKWMKIKVGGF